MLILSLNVPVAASLGAPSLANAGRKLSIDLTVGIECLIIIISEEPCYFAPILDHDENGNYTLT